MIVSFSVSLEYEDEYDAEWQMCSQKKDGYNMS